MNRLVKISFYVILKTNLSFSSPSLEYRNQSNTYSKSSWVYRVNQFLGDTKQIVDWTWEEIYA